MGANNSINYKEQAKSKWDYFQSDFMVRTYVNAVLDSRAEGSKLKSVRPSEQGGQFARHAQQNVLKVIVDKTPSGKKWIPEIVFSNIGVGGYLIEMLFQDQDGSNDNLVDDIEKRVKNVIEKHMSSERCHDLHGAIKNIVQLTFIDRENPSFIDRLYDKAIDLREKLNSLSFAIKAGNTPLGSLQAFITGHNILCMTYQTIYNLDPSKVIASSYEKMVKESKDEILTTSENWIQTCFDQMKVERSTCQLYLDNGKVKKEKIMTHFDNICEEFTKEYDLLVRAELKKCCSEIMTEYVEPRLFTESTKQEKVVIEVPANPLPTLSVKIPQRKKFIPDNYYDNYMEMAKEAD